MQFPDGIPQAVDKFPFVLLAALAIAALVGWQRRRR